MPDAETTRCIAEMARRFGGPVENITVCFVGDGRHPIAGSLLATGALLGMDVRVAAPNGLWPADEEITKAEDLAAFTDAALLVTSDVGHAVFGADFVCTDIPAIDGESNADWAARTGLPALYRVTDDLLAMTGRPGSRIVQCPPARPRACTVIERRSAGVGAAAG